MDDSGKMPDAIEVHPLMWDRWEDLVALFGKSGAYSGCWCMWWRQTSTEFQRGAGQPNREAFQALVQAGQVPGLLAYQGGRPVGWCAVAPREHYGRLRRSPILRPIDDQAVWSIVCFFIDRRSRHQGVATALLRAAVRFAKERGAQIIEGYPIDPQAGRPRAANVFVGTRSMFEKAGFQEVARRSSGRPIMRSIVG